jgi:hypothetical protein
MDRVLNHFKLLKHTTSIKDTDNTKKLTTVDDDVNDLAIEDIVGQWNLKHRTLLLNYLDNAFTSIRIDFP